MKDAITLAILLAPFFGWAVIMVGDYYATKFDALEREKALKLANGSTIRFVANPGDGKWESFSVEDHGFDLLEKYNAAQNKGK